MKNGAVQIGLVGCGVVGNGVVRILQKNLALLESKAGTPFQLAWVASRRKKPLPPIGGVRPLFTKNWRDVVSDPAVDIVVELIGGEEPARTVILSALKAGKQVATANKAVLARHWDEIFHHGPVHAGVGLF
jgi:homoserine dehydrogenase